MSHHTFSLLKSAFSNQPLLPSYPLKVWFFDALSNHLESFCDLLEPHLITVNGEIKALKLLSKLMDLLERRSEITSLLSDLLCAALIMAHSDAAYTE